MVIDICEAHDNKTDYFIVEFNDPVAGLTKRVACDMVTLVKEISANEEICYKAYFDFSDSYDLSEDAFRRMQQQLFSSWMLFGCMPGWERERYFASLDLFNRVCGPEY